MVAPPRKTIDIVVPIRNEEASIRPFVLAVNGLTVPDSVGIGILFVEDSSTDSTLRTLRDTAASARNVSYYSLETGFGEAGAVAFGMNRSVADAVITMECGGGHPVESIPELISHYLAGADIVQAVRLSLERRRLHRAVGTAVFNVLLTLLTGFEAKGQNVYFRLVSRRPKDLLLRNRRFVTCLRFRSRDVGGCRVDQVYFRARDTGESKYSFTRLVIFALDCLLSMLPVARLCALLALTVLAALCISRWLGVIAGLCAIGIAARTWILLKNETLAKMRLAEQHVAHWS